MKKNIENIIEAIMFASGRSITKEELLEVLSKNLDDENIAEKIDEAILNLQKKYEDSGISIIKINDGYELVTNKKYYSYVADFQGTRKKENLSASCMEVLSIIAYNPKITKSQIEKIRGINSDSQVSKLIEYGLIEEAGRLKTLGRPAVFEVTDEFLRSMGLNKIEEMPDFEKLNSLNKEKLSQINNNENIINENKE